MLEDVDDINTHVGFWRPQPDCRIPQRLSGGFESFSDLELEAICGDQVWGTPQSNIIVASDHGLAPFHTAVSMNTILTSAGFDPTKVRAVTSGPVANIYINLQGREPDGTVSRSEYILLQEHIVNTLRDLVDTNPHYIRGAAGVSVFAKVVARPVPDDENDPDFGHSTNRLIGQDSGDVFAILRLGYNFDGIQIPVVQRLGDDPSPQPIFSVPSFYGAHGYAPYLESMNAIFFAAGPDIRHGVLSVVHNIDVAPTILELLGVPPAETVKGDSLPVRKFSPVIE